MSKEDVKSICLENNGKSQQKKHQKRLCVFSLPFSHFTRFCQRFTCSRSAHTQKNTLRKAMSEKKIKMMKNKLKLHTRTGVSEKTHKRASIAPQLYTHRSVIYRAENDLSLCQQKREQSISSHSMSNEKIK